MVIIDKNRAAGLLWIEKLSKVLDSNFTLPGTNFKFGIDPIFGFFPVIGDLTSFAISCFLLAYMGKFGASRKVIILMLGNIILDAVIGSIPLLGNIFDFTYKANNRNIRLLKKHYEDGKYQGSGKGIILIIIMGIFVTIVLIILAFVYISNFILEWIGSIF
ncbi:MAG: DUF4112 domain-containing protein [Bacteroidota bacterium]|nr:DUF4112 domain-containing protein [Bacteroidota bacterium]